MILSITIALIITVFATFSFLRELHNYRSGISPKRAKRRITINFCLFIVAIALSLGYSGAAGLKNQHELLFWGFLLLLMLAIICLAWIDLKEGLKDVEKKAVEDIVKMMHEMKKEQKNNDDSYHKNIPIQ